MESNGTPIRVFLSYAHEDEREFAFVEPLVGKVKAFVRAKTGRELEVFLDRESIGWGEDWRSQIAGAVSSATIFLPLLSANYLDSDACREEFLAFHSKAEGLGVPVLLLPLLVFKSPLFGPEAADEIAKIAEARQYKCIESGLLAGFQSPEWLQCTRDLAEALIKALTKAENALAGSSIPGNPSSPADGGSTPGGPETEGDESGLAEVMEALQDSIDAMNAAATKIEGAITQLGEVPQSVPDLPEDPSAKQINVWSLRLAQSFKTPALAMESSGRELLEATQRLDETLTKLKLITDSIHDVPEIGESLAEGRRGVVESFGDLREVADAMDELLDSMRPAEVLSVPLRRAIRPARAGLTAVRDSLGLIESWQKEFPTNELPPKKP